MACKPRIAGLSEREGRACVHRSLSCTKIERAKFQLVRQIAGANLAPNRAQRRLDFEGGSTPCPSDTAAQTASQVVTGRSVSFSARGCGFPAKEMRKAVAGSAGDQPNAMLALS